MRQNKSKPLGLFFEGKMANQIEICPDGFDEDTLYKIKLGDNSEDAIALSSR